MPRATIPVELLRQVGLGPTIDGFYDAQMRLRDKLGVDVVFIIVSPPTWPFGTPLDPESGRPYDPFVEPEEGGEDLEVALRCSFVHRPLVPGAMGGLTSPSTPIGNVDRGFAALLVDVEDYPQVKDARRVRVGEEMWDIELWRYDVALTVPRWIAQLEHS